MEEVELPSGQRFAVCEGDCVEVMATMESASVDAIVTDSASQRAVVLLSLGDVEAVDEA